ncbi:MAG: hypothetical protein GOU97_02450 [Nanoarchaeota archaeon]|nr:hypothetical protein [Nanoarchaeota archaeon]
MRKKKRNFKNYFLLFFSKMIPFAAYESIDGRILHRQSAASWLLRGAEIIFDDLMSLESSQRGLIREIEKVELPKAREKYKIGIKELKEKLGNEELSMSEFKKEVKELSVECKNRSYLAPAWTLAHLLSTEEDVNLFLERDFYLTSSMVIACEGSSEVYVAHQVSYPRKVALEKIKGRIHEKYRLVQPNLGGLIFKVNDFPFENMELEHLIEYPETLKAIFLMNPEYFQKEFLPTLPEGAAFWGETPKDYEEDFVERYEFLSTLERFGKNPESIEFEPKHEGDYYTEEEIEELVQEYEEAIIGVIYNTEEEMDEFFREDNEYTRSVYENIMGFHEVKFRSENLTREQWRRDRLESLGSTDDWRGLRLSRKLSEAEGIFKQCRGRNGENLRFYPVGLGTHRTPFTNTFGVSLEGVFDRFPGFVIKYEG